MAFPFARYENPKNGISHSLSCFDANHQIMQLGSRFEHLSLTFKVLSQISLDAFSWENFHTNFIPPLRVESFFRIFSRRGFLYSPSSHNARAPTEGMYRMLYFNAIRRSCEAEEKNSKSKERKRARGKQTSE